MNEKKVENFLLFFIYTATAVSILMDLISVQTWWLRYLLISYRFASWLSCILIGFVFLSKNDWLIKKNWKISLFSFLGFCILGAEIFILWTNYRPLF
jgi:hypothetical protein